MAGTAYSYAYNYRFTHKSDEIDMYNNSITYYYRDNEKRVNLQKTYTISDNWLSKMLIHKEEIETIGTNTTIYGPYTWLPAENIKLHLILQRRVAVPLNIGMYVLILVMMLWINKNGVP